jgi:hypothetical protein
MVLEMPVATIVMRVAEALLERLSEAEPTSRGHGPIRPRYGWANDLEVPGETLTALATAYGVKSLLAIGARDPRLDLARIRHELLRCEASGGGWSSINDGSPVAETTAVVLGALRELAEPHNAVDKRIGHLMRILGSAVDSRGRKHTYVLAVCLLTLSRLPVDDSLARPLIDELLTMSTEMGPTRWWPLLIKQGVTSPQPSPSTAATARAVCALTAWGRRLGDAELLSSALAGRRWLEANARLDPDWEIVGHDGGPDVVNHFPAAWVLRAVLDAGGDPDGRTAVSAVREIAAQFDVRVGLWRLSAAGGSLPIWMTYQAVVALRGWALARGVS